MLLNVQERVVLGGSLPEKGNFITLKLVRELQAALGFNEEEIQRYGITMGDGLINWETSDNAEMVIGDTMKALIVAQLKRLNEAQQLTAAHLTLCEKFGVG